MKMNTCSKGLTTSSTGKSARNQHYYKILKMIEFVTAASIPLSAPLFDGWDYFAALAAGFGVVIAISSAANGLFRFQENWIQYRTTAEQNNRSDKV